MTRMLPQKCPKEERKPASESERVHRELWVKSSRGTDVFSVDAYRLGTRLVVSRMKNPLWGRKGLGMSGNTNAAAKIMSKNMKLKLEIRCSQELAKRGLSLSSS